MAGVGLLKSLDLLFLHINGGEDEVNHRGDLLHVSFSVHDHHVFGLLGDGGIHGPTPTHGLFIGLASGAGTGRNDRQFEPGVILHQSHKALANHASAADHANLVFFHAADLHLSHAHPYSIREMLPTCLSAGKTAVAMVSGFVL